MIIYFYRATVCHCPSCVFWYFPRKRVAVSYDAATLFFKPKNCAFWFYDKKIASRKMLFIQNFFNRHIKRTSQIADFPDGGIVYISSVLFIHFNRSGCHPGLFCQHFPCHTFFLAHDCKIRAIIFFNIHEHTS